MRSQQDRDEVTLVIATALFLFLAVLTGGVLALLLARALADGAWPFEYGVWAVFAVAGPVALLHMYRRRRP